jgi:S-DNA-T family DNA segregation ATPase FtsK/SpoIIIE
MRLILIDPKRLEFAAYADSPHLLFPVVTQPKEAVAILQWVVHQMEERYACMAQMAVRTIGDYNKKVVPSEVKPYIVVIIDELADLMMTASKDIEILIARVAQMARAAGIHMIVATQRPSVDVITGLIKVNFPSRISFRVTAKIDSRTILDCSGADALLGKGDMLFLDPADATIRRVHGAYVTDKEIAALMEQIRLQGPAQYLDIRAELATMPTTAGDDQHDPLYPELLAFIKEVDELSISLLQRRFRIGYNRSARIIETLERQGLILPSEGGKMRKVVR